jgi:uncharacterized protein
MDSAMPTALITGASVGLGREFARVCARDGLDLVLVARSQSALDTVAEELRASTKRSVVTIARDLSEPGASQDVFDRLTQLGATVEVLINNAAFGLYGRFWEVDRVQQSQMVQLNIAALTELCQLFVPVFVARRRGYILNLASTAAFQPGPLMAVYYASKAYVVSFSLALANEVRQSGVTVTCLCPGPTATEFAGRAKLTGTRLFSGRRVMNAAAVAETGYKAMKRGRSLVIPGRMNRLMAFFTRFSPIALNAAIARKFQES